METSENLEVSSKPKEAPHGGVAHEPHRVTGEAAAVWTIPDAENYFGGRKPKIVHDHALKPWQKNVGFGD